MSHCLCLSLIVIFVASVFLSSCKAADPPSGAAGGESTPKGFRVYVGTYTGAQSKGIYLCEFDTATGTLKKLDLAAGTASPSFLALSPDHRRLYAVGEMTEPGGKKGGTVKAFAIDRATGKLTPINEQPSGGAGACHISLDSAGKHAFVANYTSGSVASFPIKADGSLGPAASVIQHTGKGSDPARQEGPHAHGIWPSPDDRFVLTCDLGLDKVLVYKLDPDTGKLSPNDPPAASVPPGAGARHAAFTPDGKFLYVINEMGNTMSAFAWNASTGALSELQTIATLPKNYTDKSYTSEVMVHPNGRFLYGSNRGHDSIAIFTVEPSTGKLTFAAATPMGGKWPRHFNIDPTGRWMVVGGETSDTLTVLRIDQKTGSLTQVGEPVEVPSPACVVFAKH